VPIIGIDLGTMNSAVAHLDEDGKPATIHNAEGDLTTPSVVLFDAGGIVVGKEALKAAALEPEIVAAFAKREMGEQFYSKPIRGHRLPPEVVQALVLRKLREDASAVLGEVSQAVITVPAFFNEPRRKATQDAGRLAGLDVVDSYVARILAETGRMAKLMGTDTVLVGMRPEVAATLVRMGYGMEGVRTALNLDDGLALLGHIVPKR